MGVFVGFDYYVKRSSSELDQTLIHVITEGQMAQVFATVLSIPCSFNYSRVLSNSVSFGVLITQVIIGIFGLNCTS